MRPNDFLKQAVRGLAPPLMLRALERAVRRNGFFGDYPDWDAARRDSSGYDSAAILEKVKEALSKVKRGEAAYERDSVLFDQVQHSWPLLAGLLWVATLEGNRLSLVDFGGSLGSSYFQNRKFLEHLPVLRWSIVEQDLFVECGRQHFQDEHLRFFNDIDSCMAEEGASLVLLSSVLPYLEKPYELLDRLVGLRFPFLIIDRTPLLDGDRDRLTVQRVPEQIYPASYPAWFLSRTRLLERLCGSYELIARFDALAGEIHLGNTTARDEGFIFRLKERGGRPA